MPDLSALIQRWQGGDERAAEAIYNHHREATFRLAYGLLGSAADAEEAAQDALTYALTHINHYDTGRASFATWLHTITVSRCRDRQRRRWLPMFSLTQWLQRGQETPDPAPSPERQAVQGETHSEVWQAVQNLSPQLREAILLRYWADHTYQEMAAILDCPLRTAQSRVRLAFDKLRVILAPAELNHFEEERV
ncbi:MAG: RNA polymerase sigma factor [Chloroflexi bacterium]|nr:RNA polymerase sigma factor [Chloroflexota bacterium]